MRPPTYAKNAQTVPDLLRCLPAGDVNEEDVRLLRIVNDCIKSLRDHHACADTSLFTPEARTTLAEDFSDALAYLITARQRVHALREAGRERRSNDRFTRPRHANKLRP